MQTEFDNYIFDLDGTLADTAPIILKNISKALAENNLKIDEALINSDIIGPPLPQIIAKLDAYCNEETVTKIIADFRRFYDANPSENVVLFDGIKDTLHKLVADGKKCFVATNKPVVPAEQVLEALDVKKYFTKIVGPNIIPGKFLSKTEMIRIIIDGYNLVPDKTLMIGDAFGDIKGAHEAGCKAAAAIWGYEKNKEKLSNLADLTLLSATDLCQE